MIDIEKFICSLLADHPEGVTVRGDIHRALKEQGLEYKDGKIVPIEDKTELKESEDERVRKEIARFIRMEVEDEIVGNKWLAYLEKQSQTFTKKDVDDAWLKGMCDAKHELEKQGEQKSNPYSGTSFEYNGHTWGMCARDGGVEILIDGHIKGRVFINDSNAKEMFIKALERVEEQNAKGYKLTDCDKNSWWEDFKAYSGYSEQVLAISCKTCKDEQESVERKDFISIPFGTDSELVNETITIPDGCVATIEGDKIHIKKKGKSATEAIKSNHIVDNNEMVESTFNAGDWVVRTNGESFCNGSKFAQIQSIELDGEMCYLDTGRWLYPSEIRLWTINDAQDGDLIYVSTEEKSIHAIFDTFDNGIIYFHCYLCGDFTQGGYMPMGDVELVNPLPKTHHQRFFQKMKEAEYEFDFEKKELKAL